MSELIEECLSKLKVIKKCYTWKIKNFHNWPQTTAEALISPEFTINTADSVLNCNVRLFHETERVNRTTNVKDEIHLFVNFNPATKSCNDTNIHLKFLVYDNHGEVYKKFEEWKRIEHNNRCIGVFWHSFLTHSSILLDVNNLLMQDTLTIRCEFTIPCGVDNILRKTSHLRLFNESESKILSDFKQLFLSEKLSDLTIVSSCGLEFHVHKNILAARSSVFAAMFENDMLENSENIVRIADIDGKVMHELLHWIYTGKIESLTASNATEIIRAANKYAVEDLKQLCENVICESINIENAVEIFVVANLHDANFLKNECLNFVDQNMEQIMKTSGFQTLVSNCDPNLLEIFRELQKYNTELDNAD